MEPSTEYALLKGLKSKDFYQLKRLQEFEQMLKTTTPQRDI